MRRDEKQKDVQTEHSTGFENLNYLIYQLLAYTDDVNILGRSIYNLKENAEALVAATREIGLEVLINLSTRSCLEIRMQDEITV